MVGRKGVRKRLPFDWKGNSPERNVPPIACVRVSACVCLPTSLTVTQHIRIHTKANLDALTSVLETGGQQQQRQRQQLSSASRGQRSRACAALSGCESALQRSVSFARRKPLLERISLASSLLSTVSTASRCLAPPPPSSP